MKILLYALLLWLVLKGIAFLFFPKVMQDFVSQNIIDAKIADLKIFGGFLLLIAVILWVVIVKDIP